MRRSRARIRRRAGEAVRRTLLRLGALVVLVAGVGAAVHLWLAPGSLGFLPYLDADDGLPVTGSSGAAAFTVTSFQCGLDRLPGESVIAGPPQGTYCVGRVTVENTGESPLRIWDQSQKLYVGTAEYASTSEVGGLGFFGDDVNPGNHLEGYLAWDVPPGAEPDRLRLSADASTDVVLRLP